jgi:teichoic acid transport system ATP-binding protein
MFARLAFAVAINVEPDILIVDEALSVGDIFFQNKCFRKFEELKEKNTTVLYVSHDLASIKEMCDKTIWLEKGKLKMYGENLEVCNEYSNNLLKEKSQFHKIYSTDHLESKNYDILSMDKQNYPNIKYTNDSVVTEDVQIISCFITNNKGEIRDIFYAGEKCTLSIIFESNRDIKKCIAGFALATNKGMWIINPNTLIVDGKRSFNVKSGTINKVDFSFSMPKLIGGDYIIEVAIADGIMENYETLAWLYNVLNIKIINEGYHYALLDVDAKVKIYQMQK